MFSVKALRKFSPRVSVIAGPFAVLLAGYWQVCAAAQASQTTFASAEAASQALLMAVEAQGPRALTQILGPKNEILSSHDAAQDKLDREQFVHKYQEMHRLVKGRNGEKLLYIGAENWSFPIPLVSNNGAWRFDSDAGGKEVLYRRVGENEMTAIEVCGTLNAPAKKSEPKTDANDPVGTLLATAKTGHKPVQFQGYYFRIQPNSGSNTFALVAYPAAYGSSGVMTFIVDEKGVVYQKDLGPSTVKVASAMAAFQTDPTWTPADTGQGNPQAE
jgi:Protein of unknown function (DUF2950)